MDSAAPVASSDVSKDFVLQKRRKKITSAAAAMSSNCAAIKASKSSIMTVHFAPIDARCLATAGCFAAGIEMSAVAVDLFSLRRFLHTSNSKSFDSHEWRLVALTDGICSRHTACWPAGPVAVGVGGTATPNTVKSEMHSIILFYFELSVRARTSTSKFFWQDRLSGDRYTCQSRMHSAKKICCYS